MSTREDEEEDFSSDDDLEGAIDLNEDWLYEGFSDIDQDDVASLDHLSDGDDEIRETRLKMMNLNSKQKNKNVEDFEDDNEYVPMGVDDSVEDLEVGNEYVPVGVDDSVEVVEDVHTQAYRHDDFLTETCEGYDRDAFVEEEVDSENEVPRTKSNEFPIHDPNVPWNVMKPYASERYASASELKTCLTNYALANGLQLRYKKMCKTKLHVVCGPKSGSGNGCPWRLWASWMSKERSFQVKSIKGEHICGRSYTLGSLVNSNWIAKVYGKKIRRNPSIKLVELQESILRKYKCKVQTSQCSRAKAKALGGLEEYLVDHYGKLWDYGEEIMRSNPGSTVKMSVEVGPDGKNYFKRFYVCLKGVKDGWLAGCRRFIGHNSRGCKNQKKDAPTKQKNPVGRPRGSGLSRGLKGSSSGRSSTGKTSKGRAWSTSTDCVK